MNPAVSDAESTAGSTPAAADVDELDVVVVRIGVHGARHVLHQHLGEQRHVALGDDGDDRRRAHRTLQVLRRVEGQDPAVVDDRQALAELVRFLHVVRRQQHRLPGCVELLDDLVQSARRLCGSSPEVGSSRNRIAG